MVINTFPTDPLAVPAVQWTCLTGLGGAHDCDEGLDEGSEA